MKRKIEELFHLVMKVQEETSAYVDFDISNYSYKCVVSIMDNGFKEGNRQYDGWYAMEKEWGKSSEEAYQKAKEHLTKLLRTKRKAVIE